MKRRSRRLLSIFFKAAILVTVFGFIFHRLNDNRNIEEFKRLISQLAAKEINFVIAAITVLMLLNWLLEAIKWRYLLRKVERLSLWQSIKSVYCGLTFAIFTPNRIGEYGGRVLFLSPRRRVMGLVAMIVGAASQLVITHVAGAIGVLWFLIEFTGPGTAAAAAMMLLVSFYCFLALAAYSNIKWLQRFVGGIKLFRPYQRFFNILTRYSKPELYRILTYSLARFCVFTFQYYLAIHLLLPSIPALALIMTVLILFFVQSALPSIDIFDVGVRAFTASYFFGFLTNQEVAIMAAVAFIWLINLIIPAILGSIFVFKLNFFDRTH